MSKWTKRLRVTIQVILAATGIAVAIALLHTVGQETNVGPLHKSVDTMMVIVLAVFFLMGIVHALLERREKVMHYSERDNVLMNMRQRAETDALTGLLNSAAVREQISMFLKTQTRSAHHTLMIIDLDNFKDINDTFGHFQGDKVLQVLSGKIQAVFRAEDIVGRLGGDEFIVLMKYTQESSGVMKKAAELLAALEYMMDGDGNSVTVTASIGIATWDGSGKDFDALYKQADDALYRAKTAGKGCFRHFDNAAFSDASVRNECSALCESSVSIQLKALIDNIDGGIALLELGDAVRSIYLSRNFVRLMELSYDRILAADNKILTLLATEDFERIECALRNGADAGNTVEDVFKLQLSNENVRWFHLCAVSIDYKQSAYPVVLAILTDVTTLKQTELLYERDKKHLEMVLRVSNVITFEVDIAERALYINKEIAQHYGHDLLKISNVPESMIETGAIHPESADECRRMYNEIYSGVSEGSAIIRTKKSDDLYSPELFTYFTVRDDGGRLVKALGVAENLDGSRAAMLRVKVVEKAIKYWSEDMLLAARIDLLSGSVSVIKNQLIPDCDETACDYADLLAHLLPLLDGAQSQEKFADQFSHENLKTYLERGAMSITDEYACLDKTGERIWLNVSGSLHQIIYENSSICFMLIKDITSIKRVEQRLGTPLKRVPELFYYPYASLRDFGQALLRSSDVTPSCALILFCICNYEDILKQHGTIMTNDLVNTAIVKTVRSLQSNVIISYKGDGIIAALMTQAGSEETILELLEKTLKRFRNLAFFQYYEEELLEYKCACIITEPPAGDFDVLVDKACAALCQAPEGQPVVIRQ